MTIDEILIALEQAKQRVITEEIRSLTKLGISRDMSYQMVSSRFRPNGGGSEEADPFEGRVSESWSGK
ncbi:MAG: hypothetical protein ACREN8_06380 [Candidatus Dormibacteraceae bacterium]